jgi:hypothetical protein
MNMIWPNVGFIFRHDKEELVLFFSGNVAEGIINGQNTKGLLEDNRGNQLEQGKKRYANTS